MTFPCIESVRAFHVVTGCISFAAVFSFSKQTTSLIHSADLPFQIEPASLGFDLVLDPDLETTASVLLRSHIRKDSQSQDCESFFALFPFFGADGTVPIQTGLDRSFRSANHQQEHLCCRRRQRAVSEDRWCMRRRAQPLSHTDRNKGRRALSGMTALRP